MNQEYIALCEMFNELPIIENNNYILTHFDELKRKEHFHPIVPTLDNKKYQSFLECLDSIEKMGKRIKEDTSSGLVNLKKIESMRSLLDLFEMYNNEILKIESAIND